MSTQVHGLSAIQIHDVDVAIIGAGASGAIAASHLHQQGKRVLVLEKQHFPRFSVGESLLPCCMQFIEEAGMLDALNAAGFQHKMAPPFVAMEHTTFDFTDKFTPGPGTHVSSAARSFDKLLADTAQSQRGRHPLRRNGRTIGLTENPALNGA